LKAERIYLQKRGKGDKKREFSFECPHWGLTSRRITQSKGGKIDGVRAHCIRILIGYLSTKREYLNENKGRKIK